LIFHTKQVLLQNIINYLNRKVYNISYSHILPRNIAKNKQVKKMKPVCRICVYFFDNEALFPTSFH